MTTLYKYGFHVLSTIYCTSLLYTYTYVRRCGSPFLQLCWLAAGLLTLNETSTARFARSALLFTLFYVAHQCNDCTCTCQQTIVYDAHKRFATAPQLEKKGARLELLVLDLLEDQCSSEQLGPYEEKAEMPTVIMVTHYAYLHGHTSLHLVRVLLGVFANRTCHAFPSRCTGHVTVPPRCGYSSDPSTWLLFFQCARQCMYVQEKSCRSIISAIDEVLEEKLLSGVWCVCV